MLNFDLHPKRFNRKNTPQDNPITEFHIKYH